jgi:hypothetical protein
MSDNIIKFPACFIEALDEVVTQKDYDRIVRWDYARYGKGTVEKRSRADSAGTAAAIWGTL